MNIERIQQSVHSIYPSQDRETVEAREKKTATSEAIVFEEKRKNKQDNRKNYPERIEETEEVSDPEAEQLEAAPASGIGADAGGAQRVMVDVVA